MIQTNILREAQPLALEVDDIAPSAYAVDRAARSTEEDGSAGQV